MAFCGECGTALEDGAVFCGNCGAKQQETPSFVFCMECGTKIEGDGQFCPICGTSVGGAVASASSIISKAP
jgi:uncharacterized membrane protein YvbJ